MLSLLVCLLAWVDPSEVDLNKNDPRFVDHELKTNGFLTVSQLVTWKQKTPVRELTAATQPGFLGVLANQEQKSVKIVEVQAGSPAEKAGLKQGDLVQSINNQPIQNKDGFIDLLRTKNEDEELEFLVSRNGALYSMKAKLAAVSKPVPYGTNANSIPTPSLGARFTGDDGMLKVESIRPNSIASTIGIKADDVILAVGSSKINNQEQLDTALLNQRPAVDIPLYVRRGTEEIVLKFKLPEPSDRDGRGAGGTRGDYQDRESRLFKKPTYRIALIPINFTDEKHYVPRPLSEWNRMLFSQGIYYGSGPTSRGEKVYGSLNDYYQVQSFGKLSVDGKTFDPVQLTKTRKEYADSLQRNTLLNETLAAFYKREGDKILDNFDGVFFIHAGGRYPTNRGNIFWPHRSTIFYERRPINYFICPEGGERFTNISVISHEFGHLLGLKDYYARPEAPGSEGLGIWCTMATGHGQVGNPHHYSVFCKIKMGWMTPVTIDPRVKQKVVLKPVTTSPNEAVKIMCREDGSEYFLLENRIQRGYDEKLPGSGLLIWRVVDGQPVLEESHGIAGPPGPGTSMNSVPYPSNSNNSFTPQTTPSSKSQKGGGLPVHITNIQKLSNGDVTFWVGYEFN